MILVLLHQKLNFWVKEINGNILVQSLRYVVKNKLWLCISNSLIFWKDMQFLEMQVVYMHCWTEENHDVTNGTISNPGVSEELKTKTLNSKKYFKVGFSLEAWNLQFFLNVMGKF